MRKSFHKEKHIDDMFGNVDLYDNFTQSISFYLVFRADKFGGVWNEAVNTFLEVVILRYYRSIVVQLCYRIGVWHESG